MSKNILLLGNGGHCSSILDSLIGLNEYKNIGIVSNDEANSVKFDSACIIGCDNDLEKLKNEGYDYAFVAVGSVGDTRLRKKLASLICNFSFIIPNIIDPTAVVSKYSTLSNGIYVGKRAVINAGSHIGEFAIINTNSIVEHDCKIGSFVHISPSATLCGNVSIGEGSHIGAGSVIKQGLSIGRKTLIGLGSVVTKSFGDNIIAYGNPCRER